LSSSNGIGRTGTFLMIYTGMQEIDHGNGIVNIQTVAKKMLQQCSELTIHDKNAESWDISNLLKASLWKQ
jgi:ABC-type lipopolysaccharide export system ATPase subunit